MYQYPLYPQRSSNQWTHTCLEIEHRLTENWYVGVALDYKLFNGVRCGAYFGGFQLYFKEKPDDVGLAFGRWLPYGASTVKDAILHAWRTGNEEIMDIELNLDLAYTANRIQQLESDLRRAERYTAQLIPMILQNELLTP